MNIKAYFAALVLGVCTSVPFAAQATPTVPVEVWADEPDFRSLELSFDGSKIAMLQKTERGGDYQVVLFDTSDIAGTLRRLDTGEDAEPRSLFWVNDETIVIRFLLERKRRRELISLNRYLAFDPSYLVPFDRSYLNLKIYIYIYIYKNIHIDIYTYTYIYMNIYTHICMMATIHYYSMLHLNSKENCINKDHVISKTFMMI